MGVDGKAITIDLLRMPHLLLGGEDDAGRGMCLDDIITSLLFKAPPDQVKLILMDPGAGKFGRYSGLPHLYMPVVSDPERSCNAIQWAEAEMHERYRLMEVYGEKDIASYNNWQTDDRDKMLPRIVIVIDELEALVSKAPRKIEDSLCMLAHMGRAAGIHVIAATRRPIPEVLTLRIRVGIPDRIVFKTDSRHESRLLINSGGAEELCGNGDMIVSLIGQPDRMAKTAALTDEEISAVVDAAKSVRDLHTPDGNGEEGAAPSAGNDSGSSESREMGNESFPPLPEPTGRNRSLFHRRKK
jgi:S-DNA-T family DNA segregation ATPase FtsK/SpoIIIE